MIRINAKTPLDNCTTQNKDRLIMFRFSQRLYSSKPALLSLGIRREGKNRWERRVPLVPEDVERLTKEFGARVLIQPSTKRIVPDQKYIEVEFPLKNNGCRLEQLFKKIYPLRMSLSESKKFLLSN
jgi:hypothetical protein